MAFLATTIGDSLSLEIKVLSVLNPISSRPVPPCLQVDDLQFLKVQWINLLLVGGIGAVEFKYLLSLVPPALTVNYISYKAAVTGGALISLPSIRLSPDTSICKHAAPAPGQ